MNQEQLRRLMFQFVDGRKIAIVPDSASEERCTLAYTLLLVYEGACTFMIDEAFYPAAQQRCFMLAPGSTWYVVNYLPVETIIYEINFQIIQTEPLTRLNQPLAPPTQEWVLHPYERRVRQFAQLVETQQKTEHDAGLLSWLNGQQVFMDLIASLLTNNISDLDEVTTIEAGRQSMTYIEQAYTQQLETAELARRAGMTGAAYRALIKQLSGMSPSEYLHKVRINHAKQLLLTSDEPLRVIAKEVGYADEYYFIRRFRQAVGMSPRRYAQVMNGGRQVIDDARHEVVIPRTPQRIVYYGEALGDLWVLGLRPLGCNHYGVTGSWLSLADKEVQLMHDVGIPLDFDCVRELQPDLIILSLMDERIYALASGIAPVLIYDSFAPMEQRLPRLADWLGRDAEKNVFDKDYLQLLQQAAERMQAVLPAGETYSVLLFDRGNKLFVMGGIGLSALLAQISGLRPVALVDKLLRTGKPYERIQVDDLHQSTGDHLFLLQPSNVLAQQATAELINSPQWAELLAVRRGQVYRLDESKWNSGDAYARMKQLIHLEQLLDVCHRDKPSGAR